MYTTYPQEASPWRSAAEVERQASLMERYNRDDCADMADCPDAKPIGNDPATDEALMDCYNC